MNYSKRFVVEPGAKVKLHWPRLAATRAAARALRNALALDICALEELAE